MIATYMQRLQRILGDQAFERFNPHDLLDYINEARGFVAAEGECVRVLCPSTAGVGSVTITNGGTGYTSAPTVLFTAPYVGTTAAGNAIIDPSTGAVVMVQITRPGTGYSTPTLPGISFSGGGGTGATALPNLQPFAQSILGQEVYPFSQFNPMIVGLGTGAAQIIAIRSIAVSWGSMKPMLRRMTWGDFQAYLRSYNVGVQGYSRVWSQFAPGTTGSFYVWPIPSQNSQMDLDCICLPQPLDLNSDAGMEPIPYPFTNAVPYKAAELAVMGEPDLRELSERYSNHYTKRMLWASAVVAPASVPDYYNPASGF